MLAISRDRSLTMVCHPMIMALIMQARSFNDTLIIDLGLVDPIPEAVWQIEETDLADSHPLPAVMDHRNGWWFLQCEFSL